MVGVINGAFSSKVIKSEEVWLPRKQQLLPAYYLLLRHIHFKNLGDRSRPPIARLSFWVNWSTNIIDVFNRSDVNFTHN